MVHARQSLERHERAGRGDAERAEGEEERWPENFSLRDSRAMQTEMAAGMWMAKADGVSDGREEHVIGNWREGGLVLKRPRSRLTVCCSVLCKVKLANSFAYNKTQQERKDLKTQLLSQKEADLKDPETFWPLRIAKERRLRMCPSDGDQEIRESQPPL